MNSEPKHSHYFKNVQHLTTIDVYRVLDLFGVSDPAIQHAVKKLLVAGGRGHKDITKDIQESIDTLLRWQGMQDENNRVLSVDVDEPFRRIAKPMSDDVKRILARSKGKQAAIRHTPAPVAAAKPAPRAGMRTRAQAKSNR